MDLWKINIQILTLSPLVLEEDEAEKRGFNKNWDYQKGQERNNIQLGEGMSQLEEYLEKINHLPIDVNRQLRLIKELDLRIQEDSRKLQELQEEYLA